MRIIKLLLFLLLVQVGFSQEFYVQIRVENVTDLIGMSIYIGYDSLIVEVPDNNFNLEGTQINIQDLGFLSNSTLLVSLKKDHNGIECPGTLIIGYSSIPPSPISGNGNCFRITFNRLIIGDSNIHFILDKSSIQNEEGEIEAEWFVGVVDSTNDVARVILEVIDPNSVNPEINPNKYNLVQNYPNPFNSITIIEFSIGSQNNVRLDVFDILGQKIKTLIDKEMLKGKHKVIFNSKNIATGNYYYYLIIENNKFIQCKKMTILK